MFNLLNNMGPKSLTSLFSFKSESTDYQLCGVKRALSLPQARTNRMKKSLAFNGPLIWNSLSLELKESSSLMSFQNRVTAYFLK